MIDPLLLLLQLTDSALPIGSYSHSWGLETAVQAGRLASAQQVYAYLEGVLHGSLAPLDGSACGLAHLASSRSEPQAFWQLQRRLNANRWAAEPRRASLDLGKRLNQLALKTWGLSCPSADPGMDIGLHHCLAFGWICEQAGLDRTQTVQAYLFAALTSLVSAAVRLVPLGHTEGQQLLATLAPQVLQVLPSCLEGNQERIRSFAPLQERDSQAHQHLYSRLFQS